MEGSPTGTLAVDRGLFAPPPRGRAGCSGSGATAGVAERPAWSRHCDRRTKWALTDHPLPAYWQQHYGRTFETTKFSTVASRYSYKFKLRTRSSSLDSNYFKRPTGLVRFRYCTWNQIISYSGRSIPVAVSGYWYTRKFRSKFSTGTRYGCTTVRSGSKLGS